MPNAIDLTGHVFGSLRVDALAGTLPRKWHCVCICGTQCVVSTASLRSGNTRSCGCLRSIRNSESHTKHGQSHTALYFVWNSMHQRCYNPNAKGFARYGGRGIKVCRRWHKLENFLADMGPRPVGMSVERRNNSGDYKPSNCYWATRSEQGRNKRNNVTGKYQGRVWCLTELAAAHGINQPTASQRMRRGWSFIAACTTPVRKTK